MNSDCMQFRDLLRSALAEDGADRSTSSMAELGWHQHLLGCTDCRGILEAEEALDLLLGSMPRPELPPELAQRVLARLRLDPLDTLLDLAGEAAPAPNGMAQRILAEAKLDGLLDQAGVVPVPKDLGTRVLAGLRDAGALEPVPARPRLRLLRGGRSRVLQAAAAALVVTALGGLLWKQSQDSPLEVPDNSGSAGTLVAGGGGSEASLSPVDDELLASLDLLEQLKLAESLDPVALDALVYLDASDEVVMDWGDDWLDSSLDGVPESGGDR